MRASDYRRTARQNLKGAWFISAVFMLIVLLFNGLASNIYNIGSFVYDTYIVADANDPAESPETIPNETTDESVTGNDTLDGLLAQGEQVMALDIIDLICVMFGGVFALGHCQFLLNQYHGREAKLSDLFSRFRSYSSAFLAALVKEVLIMVWSVLLIVPGIVARYRYAMTMYILKDDPCMRPEVAIRESKKLMKGHKWELFCLDMSFIGWHILGIFTLGIGNIFVCAYAAAAKTAFYRNLREEITYGADEGLDIVEETIE